MTEYDETTAFLIRARGFVERGWCRHDLARDAAGNSVSPRAKQAVAWCAYGALKAAGMPSTFLFIPPRPLLRLLAAIGGELIASFNNRQETVEPVLAAFDRAIAAGPRR
jgi:hypothetical protein